LARTADVRLTRDGDYNLSLADRAKLARTNNAQLFLSIHMNGFQSKQVDGTEMWVARQASEQSRRFAAAVLERLAAVTGVSNRGVKKRDLGVLLPARHAPETAACLAEVAFLTNPEQARRLEDDKYLQQLAAAMAEAIYLGLGGHVTAAQSLAASIGGYGHAAAHIARSLTAGQGLGGLVAGDNYAGALFLAPPAAPKPPPALNAWTHLVNFRPPAAVQKELVGRSVVRGWRVHRIEDANGGINLDYYPVKITRLPTVKGRLIPIEDLFEHVRGNLDSVVDTRISEFAPVSQKDHDKYYSDDPVGAVISIKMKLIGIAGAESGSVVVSEYSPGHWIFSTIWTTNDFDHPVSGNREFGYEAIEGGGGYRFYTRGVDRATGLLDAVMSDAVFNTGHALWTSLQEGIADFVNNNGGAAAVENPTSRRYDWPQLKAMYFGPTTSWAYGLSDGDGGAYRPARSLADASVGQSWVNVNNSDGLIGQIFFATDADRPDDGGYQQLEKIVNPYRPLLSFKKVRFTVLGYADHRDTDAHNLDLSQRRAQNVSNYINQQWTGGYSDQHENFVGDVRGLGELKESQFFGFSADKLQGFRRVDIFAAPPKPTRIEPKQPEPPTPRSERWKARILSSYSVNLSVLEVPVAGTTFLVEIVDRTNHQRMYFRYKGLGASTSEKFNFSKGGEKEWKEFSTNLGIHMRDFEGFANYIEGSVKAGVAKLSTDVLIMLGPYHQVGANPVPLLWKDAKFKVGVGGDASVCIGGLEPVSKLQNVASDY
ncbi:MAG: N-acetylmuramoyl-L-alanine amidase, partial [Pyrinomonadaceae bacterium]